MSVDVSLAPTFRTLLPGDPAPWFRQRSTSNPNYAFDSAAGRYLVLCFAVTGGDAPAQAAFRAALECPHFNDDRAAAFFVTIDPADEQQGRLAQRLPGIRVFWDFDGAVSRLYGAVPEDARAGSVQARRFWMVIDPTMRVMAVFGLDQTERLLGYLDALPPPGSHAGFEIYAPVLVLPRVFEPEFCRRLIAHYDAKGGEESGFMRQEGGKTVGVHDRSHKSRKDVLLDDTPELVKAVQARVARRVKPEIAKVHAFDATRMERYLVGCYAAEDGGHFGAHRDNTTAGTAHRRFAVSINLNDDFEGGEVGFPEYGARRYKAPVGGAVVFSCSLLHSVSRVTAGRRYAFLPFLYDDAAAKVREANNAALEGGGTYRAGP